MIKSDPQAHRRVMLDLLREIDRICRKHEISYMLFAGSALGAVRHEGFIPWDDDLDVILLREEYERFLALAPAELGEGFFLQKEYSEHWPMFFSKLRKNDTACMEKFVPRDRLQHQGIYVDIFPADNLCDFPPFAFLQFISSKVVIAKSLYCRGYLTDSLGKKMFMLLCRALPAAPFRRLALSRNRGSSRRVHSFFGASRCFAKSVYPREWFTETEPMPFEGGSYPVSRHFDELLRVLYGDYLTPSSLPEREVKEHAALVDPENSYENYLDWQAEQKYQVYTRSIR